MKLSVLTSLIFSLSLAPFAHAQDSSATSNTMQFSREEAPTEPRGVLPFLGFGGGYTGYDNSAVGSVEGIPTTIKLIGSWYLDSPNVFDLGYGYNNQQFSQSSATDTSRTDGDLELAWRYRLPSRWQAGIIANQLFNQGKAYSADFGDAQFVGIQGLKEFNFSPSWLARVGLRAQTLTNNTGYMVNMYMIDLQIGWNPSAYRTSARSTAAVQEPMTEDQNAMMDEDTTEPARPVTIEEQNMKSPIAALSYGALVGSAATIEFNSAKYALSSDDKEKLSKVSKALADNRDLFDKVEVRGYTDASGSASLNQKLSQQRANQVKSAMQASGGLKASDIIAVGKGVGDSTGSVDSDRRAELVFTGVKDQDALKKVLTDIE